MQTIAVFVAIVAAASAASITESHRLGGAFSYSTSEVGHAVVSPVVSNVVSPVASTYSVSGVPYYNYNGVPVVASSVGNVAVLRTSGVSGVQVVPATSVVQAGTPAATYKTVAGVSPLSHVGVWPYSTVVV